MTKNHDFPNGLITKSNNLAIDLATYSMNTGDTMHRIILEKMLTLNLLIKETLDGVRELDDDFNDRVFQIIDSQKEDNDN